MGDSILITGGAGFIGCNFITYFMNKYPDVAVTNLDKLTYAADPDNLRALHGNPRYCFVKGDIADRKLLHDVFHNRRINGVIHFAAETHVDNSITNPEAFINTNINGTFTLLETARAVWQSKNQPAGNRFHLVSTDEVYGSLNNQTGRFAENAPYQPRSPYSASKASANMLAISYYHTYGLNITVSNCTNNFGPFQHNEKLIPTIIGSALKLNPIPIYGDGQNMRDWLHVNDHCRAIDLIYHNAKAGSCYNVGGHNEYANLALAQKICSLLDILRPLPQNSRHGDLITFVNDRAGHDKRYALDTAKIENELGFFPVSDFEDQLKSTVMWYIAKYKKEAYG